MAEKEGFVEGMQFRKAWGGDKIPLNETNELEITAAGIRYLEENSTMKRIGAALKEAVDTIFVLASIIGII